MRHVILFISNVEEIHHVGEMKIGSYLFNKIQCLISFARLFYVGTYHTMKYIYYMQYIIQLLCKTIPWGSMQVLCFLHSYSLCKYSLLHIYYIRLLLLEKLKFRISSSFAASSTSHLISSTYILAPSVPAHKGTLQNLLSLVLLNRITFYT